MSGATLPPPNTKGEGGDPYQGTWTLIARRFGGEVLEVVEVLSFMLDDGIWFVKGESEITAIPIKRWDEVTLVKDDPDE